MKCAILPTMGIFLVAMPVQANEFAGALEALAASDLIPMASDPQIIAEIRAQNEANADLTQADIDKMDAEWRAQLGAGSAPLVDEVLARAGSAYLRERKDEMGGLITEVFVTDSHGLNVAQSDITSDYWQGDEDKFTETFGKPEGTIHLGEIELDDSTQTYQSQVSFPIYDPESATAIGAITFGVNLEMLN